MSILNLNRVNELYPQYQRGKDRRQQNIPVAVERRSGVDRRDPNRVQLDSKLQHDLFDVKKKVAKLEAMAPKLFEQNVTTQAPTFASMNNMTQDMLVKEAKPDPTELARREAELRDKASTSFKVGVIAAALAGAIGLSFLSSAGAVIAVGTALYIGSRILKTAIVKEMEDKDNVTDEKS